MVIEQQYEVSPGQKVLSGAYKLSGWHFRFKAIGSFIASGVLIIASVVFFILSFVYEELGSVGLIFAVVALIISIATFFIGKFYWKRSKSLVQGRFY